MRNRKPGVGAAASSTSGDLSLFKIDRNSKREIRYLRLETLLIDRVGLRRHDEIVLVQTPNLMRPKLKILVASIPKNLVHRRSVNLVVNGNTKTGSLSLLG